MRPFLAELHLFKFMRNFNINLPQSIENRNRTYGPSKKRGQKWSSELVRSKYRFRSMTTPSRNLYDRLYI